MSALSNTLNATLDRVTFEQHVTLHDESPFPIEDSDAAAIVSGLPCLRVQARTELFGETRRRRITLRRDHRHLTLLARTRPLPVEPGRGWLLRLNGRDAAGEEVPVCVVDARRSTVHVLVDMSTAKVVASSGDADEFLAETFIGAPLSALLSEPPRVSPQVRSRVRALIEHRGLSGRDVLQRERALIEKSGPRKSLERLQVIERLLATEPPRAAEERVDGEQARLLKLIESRAVAALRLGTDRIEGVANPGPLRGQAARQRPVLFRLQLGRSPFHPVLQTCGPERNLLGTQFGHCLGHAQPVLTDLEEKGDLFGMVDTVLNFRETNGLRREEVPAPEPSAQDLIEAIALMI